MNFYRVTYRSVGFIICLLCAACSGNQNSFVSRPVRSVANPETDLLEVNSIAFHVNDTVSSILVEINNQNLLYKRADTSKAFYANVKLQYVLRLDIGGKRIIDSASYFLHDRSLTEQVQARQVFTSFNCRVPTGSFQMDLEISDLNRHVRYKKVLAISKQTRNSAQNFLVYVNDSISFKSSFEADQEVLVEYAYEEPRLIRVDCYRREFGPALPPFSTKELVEEVKPDSSYYLDFTNRQGKFRMPTKGFYQLRASRDASEGLSLYTVDKSFPGVSSAREMIQCARYIMSRDEYEACLDAVDNKVAIDEFWLRIGGSQERARELLKRYYTRVKEANKNYSSYVPGWKTDRGMIYIVMGAPYSVFRDGDHETWIYGNEANPNSLRFSFNKKKNAFTENDFVMERSVFYRDPYHAAVEYWRQGLVFTESPR
jgi:GWxTD domain-containing protein